MDKSDKLHFPAALLQEEEFPTSHCVSGYLGSTAGLEVLWRSTKSLAPVKYRTSDPSACSL